MEIYFKFLDIGTKNLQEDCYVEIEFGKYKFIFVLDGHGGIDKNIKMPLTDYLLKNNLLKKHLKNFFKKNELNQNTLIGFFQYLDNFLFNKKVKSGVCLTCLLLDTEKNLIYILNIGDTLTSVFNQNMKLLYTTPVHDLNNIVEKNRIFKFKKESYIKNNRYKKLSMTRSLGDHDCKEIFNEPLIPDPSIVQLQNNQPFTFILATDGIHMNYDFDTILKLFDKTNPTLLNEYCLSIKNKNLNSNQNIDNVCILVVTNNIENKKRVKKDSILSNKNIHNNKSKVSVNDRTSKINLKKDISGEKNNKKENKNEIIPIKRNNQLKEVTKNKTITVTNKGENTQANYINTKDLFFYQMYLFLDL